MQWWVVGWIQAGLGRRGSFERAQAALSLVESASFRFSSCRVSFLLSVICYYAIKVAVELNCQIDLAFLCCELSQGLLTVRVCRN